MMYWNYRNMMGQETGILGFIFWLVLLVDAILLGIWLWKKIQMK